MGQGELELRMAGTVFLIIILLLAAAFLIVAEVCTPVFGLLALLAAGSAGWAVYLCFTLNRAFGLAMAVLTAVGLSIFTVATVKILPRTFLGRRLHLGRAPLAPGEGTPEAQMLAHLVGRTTVTETVLRPSGAIRIDGKRIVAQSESGMIERGVKVKVIGAAGSHVVVRKTDG